MQLNLLSHERDSVAKQNETKQNKKQKKKPQKTKLTSGTVSLLGK